MQTTGNRPPGTLPQKAKWMAADLQRWAKKFNTPYKLNPHFPMMTLMVQRAAQEWVDRPDFEKYLAAIFNAAWQDQKNIADKVVARRNPHHRGLLARGILRRRREPRQQGKAESHDRRSRRTRRLRRADLLRADARRRRNALRPGPARFRGRRAEARVTCSTSGEPMAAPEPPVLTPCGALDPERHEGRHEGRGRSASIARTDTHAKPRPGRRPGR